MRTILTSLTCCVLCACSTPAPQIRYIDTSCDGLFRFKTTPQSTASRDVMEQVVRYEEWYKAHCEK